MQESKNMNIKCLIEILKEKKYVKEVDQFCLGQKPCVLILESKYDIVIQKIMESVDDDYFAYHVSTGRIDIVDLRVLKEWLRKNCLDEINPINQSALAYDDYVTIKSNLYILRRAINNYIEDYEADFEFSNKKIINLEMQYNRLEEEEKKKLEVIDFINSLP